MQHKGLLHENPGERPGFLLYSTCLRTVPFIKKVKKGAEIVKKDVFLSDPKTAKKHENYYCIKSIRTTPIFFCSIPFSPIH